MDYINGCADTLALFLCLFNTISYLYKKKIISGCADVQASCFLVTVGDNFGLSCIISSYQCVIQIDNFGFSTLGADFLEDGFNTGLKVKNEPGKAHNLPFFPKEEELSEEELEKMLEERYKDGSKFVTYAEDDYETKRSVQRNSLIPSIKDPTIWKVKCMVQCLII